MSTSTIVATPGSASANAYCTLAQANQYHDDRPAVGTTWSSATDTAKTQAILWATRLLDRYFVWYGSVVDTTQHLLWPRYGLSNINEWSVLDWTTIPEQIQWATAEFARQLLATDRAADSDIETLGVESVNAGSVGISFRSGVRAKPVPDVVVNMIPPKWGYLRGSQVRELERA